MATVTVRRWMKCHGNETREIRGEHHGLYGKERSEEVKRKISEKLTGLRRTLESCERIRKAHLGRTVMAEHRRKISSSSTGLKRPKETRVKMSRSTPGEKNPNWQGGYSDRYRAGWSVAREETRASDEICQYCGEDGAHGELHVRHLGPVQVSRENGDLELDSAHDEEALVPLFDRCYVRAEHGFDDIS